MTKEQQLENFNEVMAKHYEDYWYKIQEWARRNNVTFDEDTFQDTYIRITNKILKSGIKAQTEQEYLNYFFMAIKFNHYQTHLQQSKQLIDQNVNVFSLLLEDGEYEEEKSQWHDFIKAYILYKLKEHFSPMEVAIFRLRYLIRINGKELNYKRIKEITKVKETRKILVNINRWLKDNLSKQEMKKEFENNRLKYFV